MIATLIASLALLPAWNQPVVEVHSTAPTSWGVGKAITHWNKNGAVTMRLVGGGCTGCITVREDGIPAEPNAGVTMGLAQPYVHPDGSMAQCDVTLDPAHRGRLAHAITAHEIGHCLGLEHTTGRWSVMNGETLTYVDRPSKNDLRRLALTYKETS